MDIFVKFTQIHPSISSLFTVSGFWCVPEARFKKSVSSFVCSDSSAKLLHSGLTCALCRAASSIQSSDTILRKCEFLLLTDVSSLKYYMYYIVLHVFPYYECFFRLKITEIVS